MLSRTCGTKEILALLEQEAQSKKEVSADWTGSQEEWARHKSVS